MNFSPSQNPDYCGNKTVRELLGIITTRNRNTDQRNGDTKESCRKFTVSLVEQKQLTLLENLSSLPGFSGVCVARSILFCVMFCTSLFVVCLVSFGHCVVCLSSIYRCRLPLRYLQTLLMLNHILLLIVFQ